MEDVYFVNIFIYLELHCKNKNKKVLQRKGDSIPDRQRETNRDRERNLTLMIWASPKASQPLASVLTERSSPVPLSAPPSPQLRALSTSHSSSSPTPRSGTQIPDSKPLLLQPPSPGVSSL